MIGERVSRLRWPRVHDQVLRGERGQLGADAAQQPQREIHVPKCRAGGEEPAGLHDHVRLVEHDLWVPLPEHRREPPGRGGALLVEQAGLRHHERADAGSADRGAASSPLTKRHAGIANVGPGQSCLQRTRHLEADGWNDDDGRGLRVRGRHRHGEALRGPDGFSHRDGAQVEARHVQPRHPAQLVSGLEDVQHDGQAEIENVVEDQDVDAHGNNDNKYGCLATGNIWGPGGYCPIEPLVSAR